MPVKSRRREEGRRVKCLRWAERGTAHTLTHTHTQTSGLAPGREQHTDVGGSSFGEPTHEQRGTHATQRTHARALLEGTAATLHCCTAQDRTPSTRTRRPRHRCPVVCNAQFAMHCLQCTVCNAQFAMHCTVSQGARSVSGLTLHCSALHWPTPGVVNW